MTRRLFLASLLALAAPLWAAAAPRALRILRLKTGAVDEVPLEAYVAAVVPPEIGRATPAALEAQAVAARSYALANRRSGAFDLYSDTRSQAYGGLEAETP
ncbi:MAG TPA: SpoIID/LytB domain-containing protein, partial [Thermoanaerobaculia bacterium]|nr:SpoIID/LytB domain-containing protein [Thermoanaerobaculia bacterium]